jgi:hypothetical protein
MSVHFNYFLISISSSIRSFHGYIDQEKELIRLDDIYPSGDSLHGNFPLLHRNLSVSRSVRKIQT